MRRLATLLMLAATVAVAAVPTPFSEAQALTRAAPALATEGWGLQGMKGYRVSICAASGQTLSGAGQVDSYLYDPGDGLWKINPGLVQKVTASGMRCQVFPDQDAGLVSYGSGTRFLPAANGVTVSSGTVVVRIVGCYAGNCS